MQKDTSDVSLGKFLIPCQHQLSNLQIKMSVIEAEHLFLLFKTLDYSTPTDFFPTPFAQIALILVLTSQMALLGFFCDSSLFCLPVKSWTRWSAWQQALWEWESAQSGGRKKELRRSLQNKPLCRGRDLNQWPQCPQPNSLTTRPRRPANWSFFKFWLKWSQFYLIQKLHWTIIILDSLITMLLFFL